ncbi:MAG: sensor histidine kinase [Rhodospirillaceae bacterium]|nr:sensor histidine kinase [Rhodospirillaceae bacterium]MBT6428970.1 sensor histidine kinase [Rhodospirillaceae bacterium]
MRERKAHTLNLVIENLHGALAKFQYQPSLLAKRATFRNALDYYATTTLIDAASRELEKINFLSGALDMFIMNGAGIVIASSNWATEQSYRGQNFGKAPYFRAALQGRLGRHFAVDDASEPHAIGYFFAYPVRRDGTIVGAIVIKLHIERLAARWLAPDHETLVVDQDGIIFMSSRADWRFRSLKKLPPNAQKRIRQSKKYGDRSLASLPVSWNDARDQVTFHGEKDTTSLLLQKDILSAGWRVLILARLDDIDQRQTIALAVASFMLVSLILLAAFAHQRRLRLRERMLLQAAAQSVLESDVAERTRDLTEANAHLRQEISDRRRAETELKKTQDELVQATKMAALGQMSAGLSHELNQPLAAIRSYSDNARAFLERANLDPVRTNLASISELTDRMARIIRNLRVYARNEPMDIRPTSVGRALDEALALLAERLKSSGTSIHKDMPDDDIMVDGGEVRLQQIFVNVISNAIDAMKEAPEKRLEISVEDHDEHITVLIHDTGPGLPHTKMNDIFDPFFSTKEVGEGMGLGLSISYGIIKQFGGSIVARNHADGGAEFCVTLKRSLGNRKAAE